MAHQFKFFKGRENVEIVRIGVTDPANQVSHLLNESGNIDPGALIKIELVVGDVVISSPGEITWVDDIVTIKPSVEHLALLGRQGRSSLIVYQDGNGKTVSTGYVFVS